MLYDEVRGQIERLIPIFGVSRQATAILASFDVLCRESLAVDARQRRPEHSRINADGTPFQFALALGRDRAPALQFLAEAGRPGCPGAERLAAAHAALAAVATTSGLGREVDAVRAVVAALVPDTDADLVADPSGALWFALGFSPDDTPSLTTYLNGRWGSDDARWRRLDRCAALLGADAGWRAASAASRAWLTPLGMAITVTAGAAPRGRIYLHGSGLHAPTYRALFLQLGDDHGRGEAFDGFVRHMLGADAAYPIQSAVFSVEVPDAPAAGVKFEVCAHCACDDDRDAAARVMSWLRTSGLGAATYDAALTSLRQGRPLPAGARPSVHAYAGVGVRGHDAYASLYLNPGPLLATT